MSALSFFLKRKDTKHQKSKTSGLTLDFYSFKYLNRSNITFGMSHANSTDFNTGSHYNVNVIFFGLVEIGYSWITEVSNTYL